MAAQEPARRSGGLSGREAARRLRDEGPNALPQAARRTTWRIAAEVAREPMLQLLAAAVVVYLVLGDRAEAAMLLGFVALIVAITLIQERRTERVLEALRDLTSPRAMVLRDGRHQRIAGPEVVRGDVIVLKEGDRVPADAWLLSANDLSIDESLLTGEALPVARVAAPGGLAPGAPTRPGANAASQVFAGTLVVGGQGVGCVTATGRNSEIGRIGLTLGGLDPGPTPLHAQTRRLVRVFSALGLGVSLLATLLYALTRGDWLAAALAGITLAMSMLPQEFLLILTVFMATGAWRLSRQRVLTRRSAAIEALGAATVLCTDKTGTLTLNRMSIAELHAWHAGALRGWSAAQDDLPAAFHELVEVALLASEREPFDAMEKALHELARSRLPEARRHPDWRLVHEYPLTAELPAMTHVWSAGDDAHGIVATKGAPEAVGRLCRLPAQELQALRTAAQTLAERGQRVLAVARAESVGTAWPESPLGFQWSLLGLVALADPLRPGVAPAVQECRQAGIRVVMITGDHPGTAQAIARQAGIDSAPAVMTGADIATLDEAALRQCVARTTVFARVLPEHKLRIVQALRARGEVVAMTGDGVNDAPSLKAAHIGIAMGERGTDVAREAAALVLLDDDFGSIVKAVRLGRRIHDNLRKAMSFVLAVHVPIAGLALLPLLLGWPVLFLPVHIAFLELVIDPVCSIVFEAEPEEEDLMRRPPRPVEEPLFSLGAMAWSLLQGGCVLLAVAGLYMGLLRTGIAEGEARASAFLALVLADFGLILACRSFRARLGPTLRRPNQALWLMLGLTTALLAVVLGLPAMRGMFHFAALQPASLVTALALGLSVLLLLDGLKPVGERILARRPGKG
ncbi:cation-translocating P-type ATPase [Azohydromonas caseinilytica]|uniref:cation-translocating P-type ATPase n=1 Tax=Azohydromonas caseinilytica TaxID=2728836 RepID=UPI002872F6E2|nr:cation-translocating P-type ATPase [Azohydromonas caseinilytica]